METQDQLQHLQARAEQCRDKINRGRASQAFLDSPHWQELVRPVLGELRESLIRGLRDCPLDDESRFKLQALAVKQGIGLVDGLEEKFRTLVNEGNEAALELKDILGDAEYLNEQLQKEE